MYFWLKLIIPNLKITAMTLLAQFRKIFKVTDAKKDILTIF